MSERHRITADLTGTGEIDEAGSWGIVDLGWSEWECSCGQSFTDIEKAWTHYYETSH